MTDAPLSSKELFVQARDLLRKIAGETDAARMEVNAWEAMELSRKMRAADELPQQASKERVSELISYWESCDPGDETFIREDILRDTIALLKSESVPSMGNADHDVFPVPLSPKGELRPHVLAEPPSAWQPIETAPQGDAIVWLPDKGAVMARLCGDLWYDLTTGWLCEPTLWAPMPAGPAVTKEPVPSNGCGCEGACAKRMGHEVQGECAADEHERSVETSASRGIHPNCTPPCPICDE